MFLLLIILIPLLAGIAIFALPKMNQQSTLTLATLASSVLLLVSVYTTINYNAGEVSNFFFSQKWLIGLNSTFILKLDGLGALMSLLVSIGFILIFLSTDKNKIENPKTFYGLMLLACAGLQGVFLAYDAMLFYFFWELALIPVYFLCSMYGAENRIRITFKFFIYTFIGSLLMLLALIYMYNKTPDHSFSWQSFSLLEGTLTNKEQTFLFVLMFIAFAIKMPIFPFHTWQPDAYQTTFTPVTMVLSGLMVKMGLFGIVRWIIPALPQAFINVNYIIIILCVISIVYASFLALAQKDIKRMVAYSSIAHIGLMCAAVFSANRIGMYGAGLQMFNHGISIIGMWILVNFLERNLGTTDMTKMGGVAKYAQAFTIFLVLITLANIALPLTNGFQGEFLMFNALFNTQSKSAFSFVSNNSLNMMITIKALLAVILGALYSLRMVQNVAFGESKQIHSELKLSKGEWLALSLVAIMILYFGFNANGILNLLKDIMGLAL